MGLVGRSSDLAGGELGGPAVFILPIILISPLCQYSVTSPTHIHIHTISMRSLMAVLGANCLSAALLHLLSNVSNKSFASFTLTMQCLVISSNPLYPGTTQSKPTFILASCCLLAGERSTSVSLRHHPYLSMCHRHSSKHDFD